LRLLSVVVLSACIFVAAGCQRPPKDSVSGKVTLNGQPVMGIIRFIGSKGVEAIGPIMPDDGSYTIHNPPQGDVDVTIEAMVNQRPTQRPPVKYAKPGLLKFTVTGGKQVKDFDLTP